MTHLRRLVEGLTVPGVNIPDGVEISGLTCDSRRTRPGDLFVALQGFHHDGHDSLAAAAQAGAAAVLVERPMTAPVPVVRVPSTQAALSPVSARFFGFPSRDLRVVGVTGTNGKTTITYLLEHILTSARRPTGVIGTIEYRWPGHREKAVNTTPLALDVHRLLAAMRDAGVRDVAMEVSSHSLAQQRVEDVDFTVAVFTNLTQDHLDFHKDMESYFQAKARLFAFLSKPAEAGRERRAVINRDDPWAPKFLAATRAPVWTYGLTAEADLGAEDVRYSGDGLRFQWRTPQGRISVTSPLVGRHNVYNLLAAAGAGMALGLTLPVVAEALAGLPGVPGRLERVTEDPSRPSRHAFRVFVDYAHTEDALENVLNTLRPLTEGRLIVLFGCGGDRDKTKRPRMGRTAARLADRVVITSDNPRSEDPAQIAREIEEGVRSVGGKPYEVVLDRAEAIGCAIAAAKPGDVVLLAGKGHETTQIFKDRVLDFDDRLQARQRLSERA